MNKRLWSAVKLALAAGLLWYLYRKGLLSPSAVAAMAQPGRLPVTLAAAACYLFSQALAAARLRLLLSRGALALGLAEMFRLTMIGNFFNNVIPGAVSGDFVKGYCLVRLEREKGRSAGLIVLDRVIGVLSALTLAGAGALYLLWAYPGALAGHETLLRLGAAGLIGGVAAAAALALFSDKLLPKLPGGGFFKSLAAGLEQGLFARDALAYAFALSLVLQLAALSGLALLGVGFVSPSRLAGVLAASSFVPVLGAVPVTPGNVGFQELVCNLCWGAVGLSGGAAIFFSWRLTMVLCSLPWGLAYLARGSGEAPVVHTQETYGLRPEASEFPMMSVLSFVYPCNALCPHCPYTNSNIRKSYQDAPFMPEGTFKKIADESGPYKSYLRVSGGGEPMLHPQATELLVYAKSKGCRVGLITNGSKFTEQNARALLSAGVDMIEFSVDAMDEKTYEVVREGLDWTRLVETVKMMLALRRELKSESKIVASGVNQKLVDIDAVERFWVEEIGVDNFIKRKFLTWGVNTSLDAGRSADPTPYLNTDEIPCPFIFERLNIDSRGNVMVCGYDIAANTSMGNVNTQTIKEIWHGEGFKYYRDKHLARKGGEIEMCRTCPDWKYRSWQHNYWKVVKNAEKSRREKLGLLSENDDFQVESDA